MTRDFAKSSSGSKRRSQIPSWVWFLTGFVSGMSVTFLVYLDKFVPSDPNARLETGFPALSGPDTSVEEMEWDFYEIFPKAVVPIVEEFAADGKKTLIEQPATYLLQAGSFRRQEDANKLRARLILLGLEVFSKEVTLKGEKWHRVLIGPIDSLAQVNRIQDQLAAANLHSIPLKIKP